MRKSIILFALTLACSGAPAQDPTPPAVPPAAPTALTAELLGGALAGTDVKIAWTAADATASDYIVERRSTGPDFAAVATVPATEKQWTDVAPVAGSAYTYRVKAKSNAGESGPSPEARIIKTAAAGMVGRTDEVTFKLAVVYSGDLKAPTSLAVDPKDGSVWIVNETDSSSIVIDNFDKPGQKAAKFYDDSAHFMNHPTQLSFSDKNTFGTCQESDNEYDGAAPANFFMGPVVWTADRSIYEGGHLSHYDMLHESSWCMGITSIKDDEYWVFNGDKGAIDQYFFGKPHVLGGDDHSDGKTYRYATGEVKRVPNIPSHLAFNPADGFVYLSDTGNGRIAKIKAGGSLASAKAINGYSRETPLYEIPNSHTVTVVAGLGQPSGLFLYKSELLFVSDSAKSTVSAYDLSGQLKGTVDLSSKIGKGSLTGVLVKDEKIYLLDGKGIRVLRIDFQFP